MTDASTHSTETAPKKRTKVFRDPVHDLIYLGPQHREKYPWHGTADEVDHTYYWKP